MLSTSTPVFVVGPLRSGTSLLYAILNQHPDIGLMYECDVWDFPQVLSPFRFRRDWHTRLEFFNRSLSRHKLVFGESVSGLENVRMPGDLYRTFAENKDARLFGEKSPFYCTRLRQLAKNHPGASFILIWRDPVEIHRSLEDAAQRSRFFRRPGTLNRLIHYQEQMIHGAAALVRSGNRVHHVTYSDLIDRTEESCRGICQFLNIEFDKKMLSLEGADLSAVFRTPQHEYLRGGKIKRREVLNNGADSQTIRKLQRFSNRWSRLRREMLNHQCDSSNGGEPALGERVYHKLAGSYLCNMDGARRALFEFLPLPWLRTYRQVKSWFLDGRPAAKTKRPSMLGELLSNKATVSLSFVILAILGIIDYVTPASVSLAPFYMIPGAILTLVISRRWGTFATVISTLVWAFLASAQNPFMNLSLHPGVWLWDLFMRFLVLEIVVLLLGRIRVETTSKKIFSD